MLYCVFDFTIHIGLHSLRFDKSKLFSESKLISLNTSPFNMFKPQALFRFQPFYQHFKQQILKVERVLD